MKIKKSKTADSRFCYHANVKFKDIIKSTKSHISDVKKGLLFACKILKKKSNTHDFTKLKYRDLFYKEFNEGFKKGTEWWKLHKKTERHHLKDIEDIPPDVNLFDIIEMIIDGIMAGMARTGTYRDEPIPEGLLELAYENTIKLYLNNTEVIE